MTNNNGSGGNFINGFFWGALIGAGAVFLLGTKKGKKLLKIISEQGLERISSLEDLVEEVEEEFEESSPQSKPVHKEHSNGEAKPQAQSLLEKTKSSGKRFFKGIKRKI